GRFQFALRDVLHDGVQGQDDVGAARGLDEGDAAGDDVVASRVARAEEKSGTARDVALELVLEAFEAVAVRADEADEVLRERAARLHAPALAHEADRAQAEPLDGGAAGR